MPSTWSCTAKKSESIYTQFLNHIYLYDRLGVYTATTFELEID